MLFLSTSELLSVMQKENIDMWVLNMCKYLKVICQGFFNVLDLKILTFLLYTAS